MKKHIHTCDGCIVLLRRPFLQQPNRHSLLLLPTASVEEKVLEAARFQAGGDDKEVHGGIFGGAKVDAHIRRQYLMALLENDTDTSVQVEVGDGSDIFASCCATVAGFSGSHKSQRRKREDI